MKRIKEYYRQLQYNVLQTAIESINKKFNISIKNNEHLSGFIVDSNLTSDLMKALNELGYQITKIPKK